MHAAPSEVGREDEPAGVAGILFATSIPEPSPLGISLRWRRRQQQLCDHWHAVVGRPDHPPSKPPLGWHTPRRLDHPHRANRPLGGMCLTTHTALLAVVILLQSCIFFGRLDPHRANHP